MKSVLCFSCGKLPTEMYDGMPGGELPAFPEPPLEDLLANLHMVLSMTNQFVLTNLPIMTHLGQVMVQKIVKTHLGQAAVQKMMVKILLSG